MTTGVVGTFHAVRLVGTRRAAVSTWWVTTDDPHTALRVCGLLGGVGAEERDAGGWEVDTGAVTVPIVLTEVGEGGVSFTLAEYGGLGAFRLSDPGLVRWLSAATDRPPGVGGRGRVGEPADLIIRRFEMITKTGAVVRFLRPVILAAE